ncbi:MAG: hypothetical protein Q8P76_01315 [bacterium]|nr:hypothetical protein [bacterium]
MIFKKITSAFSRLDSFLIFWMRQWGVVLLRVALGIVFLWFGALKIFQLSPVADLIGAAYPFLPEPDFLVFLGVWEAAIGLGLIFKLNLRFALALLWLQMAGTIAALWLAPDLFFQNGNVFLLTTDGEFIIKNLVLIASGLVIGGSEVKNHPETENK